MLNERQIDLIIERLVRRITQGNSYILKRLGKILNKIKNVDDDKIYQLQQELKYGDDFNDIMQRIRKITALNIKDIDKIFMEVARKNQQFAKKYYDYKNIDMTPLDENESLKQVVSTYSSEVISNYRQVSNNVGYTLFNTSDILLFLPLAMAYQNFVDYAILKRFLGKQVFIQEIKLQVKKMTKNGLKSYDYSNGRSYRLDNALKMQMQQGIRDMTNDLQRRFGEEYGADGIEISVHDYPAPDHAEVQGHQFTNEEFEKFQNDMDATDINGVVFPAEFEGHDRRAIGEYNCYHYVFHVLLGIDEPQYSHEDLSEIVKQNDNGFFFEGKHYTMYEGTQLQNRIEREIQGQEDIKTMAQEMGDKDLEMESRRRIVDLSSKYKELSDVSGLPTKMERMRVPGYRRTRVK